MTGFEALPQSHLAAELGMAAQTEELFVDIDCDVVLRESSCERSTAQGIMFSRFSPL
jgi:hypothetical protein